MDMWMRVVVEIELDDQAIEAGDAGTREAYGRTAPVLALRDQLARRPKKWAVRESNPEPWA
jgi:hypothetical protein